MVGWPKEEEVHAGIVNEEGMPHVPLLHVYMPYSARSTTRSFRKKKVGRKTDVSEVRFLKVPLWRKERR